MNRKFILVYLAFILWVAISITPGYVIPDGAAFCSYNASLILDGDLNFYNEFALTGIIGEHSYHGATGTETGYVSMLWTIGAPLLWLPFWLLGHLLTNLSTLWGQSWIANGFTIYYNLGVRFATAFMGLLTLLVTHRWVRNYCGKSASFHGITLAAIGTPFYWYAFLSGDCPHIPASFAIAAFLLAWQKYRVDAPEKSTALLLGLLGGLATIIKPNHVVIFLFPIATWISTIPNNGIRCAFIKWKTGWVVLGGLFVFSLQICIWQILFGGPLGPITEKGIAHYYGFFTGHFRLREILFSSYHGLFFFSPVLLLSLVGLFKLSRKDRSTAAVSLFILSFQLILMAFERFFWEGASFGLRRLVDWTPLFALGIATAMDGIRNRAVRMLPYLAAFWTCLLVLAYRQHPFPVLNDYQPPGLILRWMEEAVVSLPSRLLELLAPAVPTSILAPALLVFGLFGFILFRFSVGLCEDPANLPLDSHRTRIVTSALLTILLLGYALVGRATWNNSLAKAKYATHIEQLKDRSKVNRALYLSDSLIREGKYDALTGNWDSARDSFLEAIEISPMPKQTAAEIKSFVRDHLKKSPGRDLELFGPNATP